MATIYKGDNKVAILKVNPIDGKSIDATATIDDNVGTPSVEVTSSIVNDIKKINFDFKNLKGEKGEQGPEGPQGDKGDSGIAAGFGIPTASIDSTTGTPKVVITSSGSNTSKIFNFAFSGLKGPQGEKGEKGEKGENESKITFIKLMDNTTFTLSSILENPLQEFLIIPTYDNSILTIRGFSKLNNNAASSQSKNVTINSAVGMYITPWGIYINGEQIMTPSLDGYNYYDATLSCGSTRFHIYTIDE